MKVICKDCICLEPITNKEFGYCHKNIPLSQASNSNFATFPKVHLTDYCFEGILKTSESFEPSEEVKEPQLLVEDIKIEPIEVKKEINKKTKKSKDIEG